jgi:antitoxin (DNA-binding transcriptional repressor) of toxin-antitoxin stability system
MRAVGLKVLKNRLSEYIRLAAEGETVLVTDRDRVVAEITPPSGTRAEQVSDALLADLVRRGIITPPLQRGIPPRLPIAPLEEVLEALAASREDR